MKVPGLSRRNGFLALGLVFLGVVLPNVVAWRHAWRFTHFVEGGSRTEGPEALGTLEKARILVDGVRVTRPRVERPPSAVGLALAEQQIGDVHVWTGEGTWPVTVALFHGYGATKADLLDEARAFHDQGMSVVLVDFPGSGDSPGDRTTLGWDEANTVREIVKDRRMHRADDSLVLYGKSMGSVAILRAVSKLDVTASCLVLENPFDRLVTTVGHRFEAMGLPAFPGAQLLVFWGGIQVGFNGFRHNPVEYARTVPVPTLLLIGEQDPRVHVDEVESISSALAGPRQVVVFPGAGHVGLLHADGRLWEASVSGFLGSQGIPVGDEGVSNP